MTKRETIITALATLLRTTGLVLHHRPVSEPKETQTAQLALIPQGSTPAAVAGGTWGHTLNVLVLITGPTTAVTDAALESVLAALAADLTLGGELETPLSCGEIAESIDLGRGIIYGHVINLRLYYETARWSV